VSIPEVDKQGKDDAPQQKSKKLTAEEKTKKNMEKRLEKKKRMKDMFDAEYDARGGKDATFFDDLKTEMEQQAQVKCFSPRRALLWIVFTPLVARDNQKHFSVVPSRLLSSLG